MCSTPPRMRSTKRSTVSRFHWPLFAGPHVPVSDDRFDYGETREVAFGRINGRLFVCVYVDRGAQRRLISLRKANKREVKRYGEDLE